MKLEDKCRACGSLVRAGKCVKCGLSIREYSSHAISLSGHVKDMMLNPGKAARDFIDKEWGNFYIPLTQVILLSGLSAFISYRILDLSGVLESYFREHSPEQVELQLKINRFISRYYSFVILIMIPFFALVTKIALRKERQTYKEHMVMNAYFYSFYCVVSILLIYPFFFLLKGNPQQVINLTYCSYPLTFLLLIWFLKGFYTHMGWGTVIRKVLFMFLLLCLFFVAIIIISLLVGVAVGLYYRETDLSLL